MTISNAVLFKQAHAMTRATIQTGDDYRVTFGLCLKAIKASQSVKLGFIQTIVIILAAILFAATATAIELPAQKGAIVYANKDGQKVAFEVTTVSNNGNKVSSSNGYNYDDQASKEWLKMYNSEQTRLSK